MTSNRHASRFGGMFELPMAALLSNHDPAIVLNYTLDFTNSHELLFLRSHNGRFLRHRPKRSERCQKETIARVCTNASLRRQTGKVCRRPQRKNHVVRPARYAGDKYRDSSSPSPSRCSDNRSRPVPVTASSRSVSTRNKVDFASIPVDCDERQIYRSHGAEVSRCPSRPVIQPSLANQRKDTADGNIGVLVAP